MEAVVKKIACLLVAMFLIGFGCGGGGGGGGGNLTRPQKPVADAGVSQTVPVNILVQLDGSRSASPSRRLLTYQWVLFSKPAGSTSTLNNGAVANPTFLPDTVGSYVLRLVVNDGVSDSENSSVTITAVAGNINIPPVADAGPDQNVVTGVLVTLDGSESHDANGDPITYSWRTITRPTGSTAALQHPTDAHPDFTPDVTGDYIFGLTVTDNNAAQSSEDTVTIVVKAAGNNVPPVADAGPNQNVVTGATVTLDGSGSHDPNPGDILTYSWSMLSMPSGSFATLWTPFNVKTTFTADVSGSYVFALVATDNGSAASDPSIVTISADRLASISVTPLDCVTTLGFSVQYTALGTYEIASQKVLTDNVTWTSDNPSVATIDATGFARTWSDNVTIITASYPGVPPFSTTLRVGQVTLQSLEITNPSPVTMKVGQKVQLEVLGHYSDGTVIDLTKLAKWTVSDVGGGITVGDIYDKGLVSAWGVGTGEVLVTYMGKDARVTVNVTL